jgi:flagellar hook-associated protein FlgK
MVDLQTPLAGMNRAATSLDRTAAKIAYSADSEPGADSVDLSAEMIALIEAQNSFSANANVAHTYDEMSQTLLNTVSRR